MRGPSKPPAPVSGVSTPSCSGVALRADDRRRHAAPVRARRRSAGNGDAVHGVLCGMSSSVVDLVCAIPGDQPPRKMRRMSGSAASAAAGASRWLRPSTRMYARSRDGQGLARVLLHHGDRDAVAVDRDDVVEQALARRSATARPRARRAAAASARPSAPSPSPAPGARRRTACAPARRRRSREHREARRTPRRCVVRCRVGSTQPPISRFSRTLMRREDVLLLRHVGDAEPADLARRQARDRPAPTAMRRGSGCSNPAIVFSSVDLPAPFGPMMHDDLALVDAQVHALQHFVGGAVAGDDVPRDEQHVRRRRGCVVQRQRLAS